MIKVIYALRKEVSSLCKIAIGFFEEIERHKYKKNRFVLPYHRLFAITIFTIFKGDLEEITLFELSNKLRKSEGRVYDFLKENMKRVLFCLL